MKNLILAIILSCSVFLPAAQQPLPAFGEIDPADLQLRSCSFEKPASAMKLLDIQEVSFEYDYYATRLVTEKRVRIKVFNEKGYKYASIKIPYYSKKRVMKIKDLEGVVYNLDESGKVITQKLEKKDFFKEKAMDKLGIINFTFPNLKPGSVVEFRYRKIEKDIIQVDPWLIQDDIPVAYTTCIITTPNTSRIREKIVGADSLKPLTEMYTSGSARYVKRTYFRENIPSFRHEPFMSSVKDNLLKVMFLLIPRASISTDLMRPEQRWSEFGDYLLSSPVLEGQLKKKIRGTESIIDSAKQISSLNERIRFIYKKVRAQLPDKGEQTAYPEDISEAWENHYGSTAETNLILLSLLQKSGIEAYPLLFSTRDNGKINIQFPSPGQLNGLDVLAKDSADYYVMDASLKYQSPLIPPFNILNREALLLKKEAVKWLSIGDSRPLLKNQVNISGLFTDSGYLKGSAYNVFYDYAKSGLLDSTSDDETKDYFNRKTDGLDIHSVTYENTDNDNQPLVQRVDFDYTGSNTGDYYFINPQLLSGENSNPFILNSRQTDIDLGCNQELVMKLTIEIPESFSIDHIPSNIQVRAPDTSFLYKRIVSTDSIRVFYYQQFEIKYPLFYKEQYAGVKEFFDRVYALMAEEIVLKKRK
ncbi:MAG: DUF3857 domain-containing protein [Sphingobacteriales bacterium]|nr:DUF3857 domain-containing protein [Sphingobacteriales bacterium]